MMKEKHGTTSSLRFIWEMAIDVGDTATAYNINKSG